MSESCLGNGSPKLKELLLNTGVITVSIPALKPNEMPLASIRDCVADQSGATTVSDSDLNRFVDRVSRVRRSELGSAYNAREDQKRIREAYQSKPACFQIGKADQTSSAMRTWLSAQAISSYVTEERSEERAIRAGGFLYTDQSLGYGVMPSSAQVTTPTEMISRARMTLSMSHDSDAVPTASLFSKIVLGQSELRDAIGCRDTGVKPICQVRRSSNGASSSGSGSVR